MSELWKIDEVAKHTGLAERTLRTYQRLGLLIPTGGEQLYCTADLLRLQQINSLKQLGFSLEQIKTFLNHPDSPTLQLIASQLEKLKQEADTLKDVSSHLENIASSLSSSGNISSNTLFEAIKQMNRLDTPEP